MISIFDLFSARGWEVWQLNATWGGGGPLGIGGMHWPRGHVLLDFAVAN